MAEGETIEVLCGETDSYEDWVLELNHSVLEHNDEVMGGPQLDKLLEWAGGDEGYAFWVRYHYGEEVPA